MKRAGKVLIALGGIVLAGAVAAPFVGSLSSFVIGVTLGTCGVTAVLIACGFINPQPKPGQQWHVIDEELPDELSATEREMQAKGREVLRWPGHCSHGDTYDHEHGVLERSFGRKSEDDTPEEPSVAVFHLNAEEWAAARDQALADIGCTWPQLASMAYANDFVTSEHKKVWLAIGGRSSYEAWVEENEDAEVTPALKEGFL